jgi:hypothetical protein
MQEELEKNLEKRGNWDGACIREGRGGWLRSHWPIGQRPEARNATLGSDSRDSCAYGGAYRVSATLVFGQTGCLTYRTPQFIYHLYFFLYTAQIYHESGRKQRIVSSGCALFFIQ